MGQQSFRNSLKNAINGFREALNTQRNMRFHAVAALTAITLGVWLHITRLEWAAILGCIGLVISMELVNSALEMLLDRLHPERHPMIGKAKDMAAAAVLVAAVCSLLVGFAVFYVRIAALFH